MKDPWTGEERDRDLNALDGALEAVLERVTEGGLASFEVVKNVWEGLLPEHLRERSRPVRLEKGVLTVEAADGGAASGLRFEQTKIKRVLAEHLGKEEVAQIRIKVARQSSRSRTS